MMSRILVAGYDERLIAPLAGTLTMRPDHEPLGGKEKQAPRQAAELSPSVETLVV